MRSSMFIIASAGRHVELSNCFQLPHAFRPLTEITSSLFFRLPRPCLFPAALRPALCRLPSFSSPCLLSPFLFLLLASRPCLSLCRLRSFTSASRCLRQCLPQAYNQHPVEKHRNMAATSTPAATHDCRSNPTIRRWNHYSTLTSTTQVTLASKAPPDTTHVLWRKLLLRLEEEKLSLDDLPTTEELL